MIGIMGKCLRKFAQTCYSSHHLPQMIGCNSQNIIEGTPTHRSHLYGRQQPVYLERGFTKGFLNLVQLVDIRIELPPCLQQFIQCGLLTGVVFRCKSQAASKLGNNSLLVRLMAVTFKAKVTKIARVQSPLHDLQRGGFFADK